MLIRFAAISRILIAAAKTSLIPGILSPSKRSPTRRRTLRRPEQSPHRDRSRRKADADGQDRQHVLGGITNKVGPDGA